MNKFDIKYRNVTTNTIEIKTIRANSVKEARKKFENSNSGQVIHVGNHEKQSKKRY